MHQANQLLSYNNYRTSQAMVTRMMSLYQRSICRGVSGGLTLPLVEDDHLTGRRKFWSGVGFDLQQGQNPDMG